MSGKTGRGSAQEVLKQVRDGLRGLLSLRAHHDHVWLRGGADGLRGADRAFRRSEDDGHDRITAAGPRDDRAGGSATAARPPVTDLSHMRSLSDLHNAARRGDLDNAGLTREVQGLGRRYGPFDVTRLRARYHSGSDTLTITADVRDTRGRYAGALDYRIGRDAEGKLVAENFITHLMPGFTGKGFASAFSAAIEAYFRRSGVDRILVSAGLADGGVVWAKSGYGWNTAPDKLHKSVTNMRTRIDELLAGGKRSLSAGDAALLQDMRGRFDGPVTGYPSPRELVTLTGDNPGLGEELLRGTYWHGMKKL
ncbi:hypothetical protein [Nocardia sp. NPDC024068]|uniref:hypothetical protein n=1 Tax=Nocardia sp. NPDC024068 TaxID=3157197 RepID=UPI0033C63A8C